MKGIISFVLIALLACQSSTGQSNESIINVDVQQFRTLIDSNPEYVLIDVRTPKETNAGKIENALEIDFLDNGFASNIMQVDTTKTILLYCRSGKRSSRAAKEMVNLGFKRIYNLDGGYLDWLRKKEE